jgi:hypothetical protein
MAWRVQIIQDSCRLTQTQRLEFGWDKPLTGRQFCMPTEQKFGVIMKVTERTPKPRGARVKSDESFIDLEERIRRRAYELYERRGRVDGHHTEDWLQAEADLAQERAISAARAAVKKTRKPPVAGTAKAKRVKNPGSPAQTKTLTE